MIQPSTMFKYLFILEVVLFAVSSTNINDIQWKQLSDIFKTYFCSGDTEWHNDIKISNPEIGIILSYTIALSCEPGNYERIIRLSRHQFIPYLEANPKMMPCYRYSMEMFYFRIFCTPELINMPPMACSRAQHYVDCHDPKNDIVCVLLNYLSRTDITQQVQYLLNSSGICVWYRMSFEDFLAVRGGRVHYTHHRQKRIFDINSWINLITQLQLHQISKMEFPKVFTVEDFTHGYGYNVVIFIAEGFLACAVGALAHS